MCGMGGWKKGERAEVAGGKGRSVMAKPGKQEGELLRGVGGRGVSHLELNHGPDETVPDPSSTRCESPRLRMETGTRAGG